MYIYCSSRYNSSMMSFNSLGLHGVSARFKSMYNLSTPVLIHDTNISLSKIWRTKTHAPAYKCVIFPSIKSWYIN